jgi:uncharacterized protein
MIDKKLLSILVCPVDRTPLRMADERVVSQVNRGIAAGRISNRAGQRVEQPIGGGLVRADNSLLYPVFDDIPVLLGDEAIPLAQTSY